MHKPEIIISNYSGFCFGVRRALDIADKTLKERKIIYSLSPIIHNPQVVQEFSKKGLKIVKDIGSVPEEEGAAVLVPSHGASPDILKFKNISFIDTTCPLVGRVQKIVKDIEKKGYFIIIVGDKKHPEVKGLSGIAGKKVLVLKNKDEAKKISLPSKKIAVISQTTASLLNFKEILSEIAKKDFTELVSFNTVCKNTIDRQKEAKRLSKLVDVVIVIGGKQSANTARLAEVCKTINKRTYHIESKKDIRSSFLKDVKKIGIVTGASTPPYAIDEVVADIRRRFK